MNKSTKELDSKLTDILIQHSITDCPKCYCTLESPDLGTEGAILKLLKDMGYVRPVLKPIPSVPSDAWQTEYGFEEIDIE